MKQRDKMRQLSVRHNGNKEIIVCEYARAESRGEVPRLRNAHKLSAIVYARALLRDGKRKSWLTTKKEK